MSEFGGRSELSSQSETDSKQNAPVPNNCSSDLELKLPEVPAESAAIGSTQVEIVKHNLDPASDTITTNMIDVCTINSRLHRRQINRNLMSIGLLKDEGSYSGTFGSEIETRLSAHYGINILADQFEGAKELASLVFSCKPRQFPEKFNAWIENFLPGIEFIKPAEIRNAAKILTKAGFYIEKSYFRIENKEKFFVNINSTDDVVESFGYVDSQVWTLYVAKGKIPAGDPHDLCSHAAGFIEPVYREEMKKSGRINFFVSTLHRILAEEYGPNNKIFLRMHGIGDQLRILTDHTFENMSYLAKGEPPKLVLQGNGGYNFSVYVSRTFSRKDNPAELDRLGNKALEAIIARDGCFNLDVLENVELFEEQNPEIAARFYRAQAQMSVDTIERHSQLIYRFREIYQVQLHKHLDEQDHMIFSTSIIDDLALAISKDEELSRMFNYESRLELYQAANNYFEAYLDWYCNENGMKPVLDQIKSDFDGLDFSNLEESLESAINNRQKHLDRLLAKLHESQEKHEQEIKFVVNKFIADNPDFAVKRDIKVEYPEQIDSDFYRVEYDSNTGMGKPPGAQSNLGLLANVIITNKRKTQELFGRVIKEYQAGLSVIDERSAEIHKVNANFSRIISTHIRPQQELLWQRIFVDCSDPRPICDDLKKYIDPYVLAETDNHEQVYGRIAVVNLESGKEIICISDSAGNLHIIDPSFGLHGTVLQLIEGNEYTRNLFVGLGNSKTIQHFEKS